MNDSTPIRALIVQGHPNDGFLRTSVRIDDADAALELQTVTSLAEAIRNIRQRPPSVVALDLFLPDTQGLETLQQFRKNERHVPVVVLVPRAEKGLAQRALKRGAQDYIAYDALDGEVFTRVLLHAIERRRFETALQGCTLIDGTTGLRNRRGFFIVGEPILKVASRMHKSVGLILIEGQGPGLDRSERTNVPLLVGVADVVRSCFRDSDLLARIGVNRFAVLAVGVTSNAVTGIEERLQQRLATFNTTSGAGFTRLRMAYALAHAGRDADLRTLLAGAHTVLHQLQPNGESAPSVPAPHAAT